MVIINDNPELFGTNEADLISLKSGYVNDVLTGYGLGENEFDFLTCGAEKDAFVLRDSNSKSIYYVGNGYAIITDFSSAKKHKIQVLGNTQDYSLVKFGNDTHIFYNNDLIAVVQNAELNQTNLVSAPNLLPLN